MEDSITMTTEGTGKYGLAGWLAIASAVLIIPQIVISVFVKALGLGWELYLAPLYFVNAAIGIYILYVFRMLLHDGYDFHRTDRLITIMIWVNIAFAIIQLGDTFSRISGMNYELELGILSMALFVPYSIISIVFGLTLLKLQGDLFELLRPFAYTTIAAGVCGATVILAPLGMLFAIASLVIQGMIFFRTKDEVEYL